MHSFVTLILNDFRSYQEGLDFFEVRFDLALAKIRATAWKQKDAADERLSTLSFVDGEIPHEIEVAAFDEAGLGENDQWASVDYRILLSQAIDSLPALQRQILLMLEHGFAIDSQDPEEMTIAKALNKSEKTIRLQRDKARLALTAALSEVAL